MDLLVNSANVLYVVAYFTNDMLRLRMLTVTAASILVVYFYNRPDPMLNVVCWNLFFMALNVFQIVRILQRRSAEGSHGPGDSVESSRALQRPSR
jgi:hypothetical protein